MLKMSTNKSETLNVRLSSRYKAALKDAADQEHRTISNLIEYLIAKHCREIGISIAPKDSNATLPITSEI